MSLKKLLTSRDLIPKVVYVGTLTISLICVGIGTLLPWFSLPVVEQDSFSTLDSHLTPWFKIALIVCLIITFIAALTRKTQRRLRALTGGIIGFLLLASYPSVLCHQDSQIIGDAAWLQQQHDSMTWLGGDVYRAHSERAIAWGVGVETQDPPSRLAIYRPPSARLNWDRVTDWIWWLGYGPSFTQFAGKGWFLCSGGIVLCCLCILGSAWRTDLQLARQLFRKAIVRLTLLSILTLLVGIIPVLRAGHLLEQAKLSLSEGDYTASQSALSRSCHALPSLQLDTGMLRQTGLLHTKLGNHTSHESALYRIQRYEEDGYYARARHELSLLSSQWSELPYYIQRETLRHKLRVAINEINTGQTSQASSRLDSILTLSPNCIQAAFHQQLLALQTGHLEKNRAMNLRIQEVYQGIRTKNRKGLLAASALILAQAELEAGNMDNAKKARNQSKGWKAP